MHKESEYRQKLQIKHERDCFLLVNLRPYSIESKRDELIFSVHICVCMCVCTLMWHQVKTKAKCLWSSDLNRTSILGSFALLLLNCLVWMFLHMSVTVKQRNEATRGILHVWHSSRATTELNWCSKRVSCLIAAPSNCFKNSIQFCWLGARFSIHNKEFDAVWNRCLIRETLVLTANRD